MYDAYASETEQTPTHESYLNNTHRCRPIRELTPGNHGVGEAPGHIGAAQRSSSNMYERESTLAEVRRLPPSSNSKQIFAHSNSEYIPFDDPETLINAVREVYDQERTRSWQCDCEVE